MICPAKKHIERIDDDKPTSSEQLQIYEIAHRNCWTTCSEFGKKLNAEIVRQTVQKQIRDQPTIQEQNHMAAKGKKKAWFKFWSSRF